MSEETRPTKSYEESPGVASSSRVGFYWMLALATVQSVLGCWILFADPTAIGSAASSWGASVTTIGLAFQMKNNAKKIEEGIGK